MSRNLDASMKAALPGGLVQPALLAQFEFKSGTSFVWSGIGDLIYGGNTYKGVGELGKISPIAEGTDVKADGMIAALSGLPLISPVMVPGTANPWDPRLPGNSTYSGFLGAGAPVIFANNLSTGQTISLTATGEIGNGSGVNGPNGIAYFGIDPWDGSLTHWGKFPLAFVAGSSASGPILFSGLMGAFADLDGNVVEPVAIGAAATLVVPDGATQLLLGVNDNNAGDNSGSFFVMADPSNIAQASLQEALSDVKLGAPAKIYFGLMADGSLIGSPYLVFSGLVDQPSVETDVDTSAISLALENRLSDLARPSARRYTAADQRLKYPDDTGFNWVEILNDIALRWGS